MRIHITGMRPRMVSQRTRERVTFAGALEQALSGLGHEVHRGPGDTSTADLVLGGVSSALSPGATYALVGLEHIGRALLDDTPLLLFVDDPDLHQTRAAAQSALRDLDRLYSPYLMSKRVKQSRNLDETQRTRINAALTVLAEEVWPPVLVPLHPWADAAIAAKRLRIVSDVLPVDVSSVVDLPALPSARTAQAQVWLTDQHYSAELLEPTRVSWPVIPINSATMPDPVAVYAVVRGVHQGAIPRMPGWWTPTPLYVARAHTVYLCDSEESSAIGVDTPYYLTSDYVEVCNNRGHEMLVEDQATYLKETMWNSDTLSSALADSIGRVHSSRKRATARPTSHS
jgi:hypothetical protein